MPQRAQLLGVSVQFRSHLPTSNKFEEARKINFEYYGSRLSSKASTRPLAETLRPFADLGVLAGGGQMETQDNDTIRNQVRTAYAKVAKGAGGCSVGCCGTAGDGSMAMGYSAEELAAAPEGADLGLGCGNPQAIAALRSGETVLDLGSGGGFDCFLAARRVGKSGKVIGVDMILSNCVINLSPDKTAVFHEAFRVLKPGGRLAISDVVAVKDMPAELVADVQAMTGCVSGSAKIADLEAMLRQAGFQDVRIAERPESGAVIAQCLPGAEDYVTSAIIEGRKPGGTIDCCGPTCCA